MSNQAPAIRELVLKVVHEKLKGSDSPQQNAVLEDIYRSSQLQHGNKELEQAILTEWNELFRTGLLSWGLNISNPNAPWFHLTDRGKKALANFSRDPSNTLGYLRHLGSLKVPIHSITRSYVEEALACYNADFHRAAAVMIGAAAENEILELRDLVLEKYGALKKSAHSDLKRENIKTVTDALSKVFDIHINRKTHRPLRESFEGNWGALTHFIRTTRNDAGHPASIEPVTQDSVHAALLLFPILAGLCGDLQAWTARVFLEQ